MCKNTQTHTFYYIIIFSLILFYYFIFFCFKNKQNSVKFGIIWLAPYILYRECTGSGTLEAGRKLLAVFSRGMKYLKSGKYNIE